MAIIAAFNIFWSIIKQFLLIAAIFGGACAFIYVINSMYCTIYFNSRKFKGIKDSIQEYIKNCNELNAHIQELKYSYIDINIESSDYGKGNLSDNSIYNIKRTGWGSHTEDKQTHNCSLSICKNAHNQPFKYLCKYFNIKVSKTMLSKLEVVLNDFLAVEQGKVLLQAERELIMSSISNSIPVLIRQFNKKELIKELGFDNTNVNNIYFPIYTFQYVSAGGNSSSRCDIVLDIENLERFINYSSVLLNIEESIKGQRRLMTAALREKIKKRDNYTCQKCGISTNDERNLLLEIDHIIPLSKRGITSLSNLQTLCWRCNRSKGSRIETK